MSAAAMSADKKLDLLARWMAEFELRLIALERRHRPMLGADLSAYSRSGRLSKTIALWSKND